MFDRDAKTVGRVQVRLHKSVHVEVVDVVRALLVRVQSGRNVFANIMATYR